MLDVTASLPTRRSLRAVLAAGLTAVLALTGVGAIASPASAAPAATERAHAAAAGTAAAAAPGVLTGKITLTGGGSPAAADISVFVCDVFTFDCTAGGDGIPVPYTESTGVYRLTGLTAGSYNLGVEYHGPGHFRSEWFDNKYAAWEATYIPVGAGKTVTKNVVLDPGGTVSGRIESASDGTGLDAEVGAYRVRYGSVDEEPIKSVQASNGDYTLSGLAPGVYVVRASLPGYAPRFDDDNGDGYASAASTKHRVVVGETISDVDIDLQVGSTLTGFITGADGAHDPIPDVQIQLYRFDNPGGTENDYHRGDELLTDSNGQYHFTDLAPGSYTIWARTGTGPAAERYLSTYLGNLDATTPTEATRFDLGVGDDQNVSFELQLGGAYSGQVVDSDGNPIEGADVQVTRSQGYAMTDSNGDFLLEGLDEGPHVIRVSTSSLEGYVMTTTSAAPGVTLNALPVALPAPIEVEIESYITGVVKTAAGAPLKGVRVNAYLLGVGGEFIDLNSEAYSGPKGEFTLRSLPTEPVYLEFTAASATYPRQFLGGSPIMALSDPVVIGEAGSTSTVDARLVTGGAITGVVKNKATGKVISGIRVSASTYDELGNRQQYDSGTTNTKGAYVIPGLDAGGYHVGFNEYATGPGLAYGSGEAVVTVPERGTVTVNSTLVPTSKVSGIVRDAANRVAEGVEVVAREQGGMTVTEQTSATGAYAISLTPGTWTLQFSDPERRGASGYYSASSVTGVASPADATKLVVVGKGAAFTARNFQLVPATGSITTTITGNGENDPGGWFTLQRYEGGDWVGEERFEPQGYGRPLNELFPLTNVRPGDYRIQVSAYSRLSDEGGEYPQVITDEFTVGSSLVTVPDIHLGSPDALAYEEAPQIETLPVMSGIAKVGESLWIDNGTWNRTPQSYLYRWTRNGKPIPGATTSVYEVRPGDAGTQISAAIVAFDVPSPIYIPPFEVSVDAPLLIVKGDPANPLGAPAGITGSPLVGKTLTVSPGGWDLPGLTFSYHWQRDGFPIAGATAATYKATAADVGATMTVAVTAKRPGFESQQIFVDVPPILPAVAMKPTKAPVVTKTATGYKVSSGTWTPSGSTYAYEWFEHDPATDAPTSLGFGSTLDVPAGTTRITVKVRAEKVGTTPTTVEVNARLGAAPYFDVAPVHLTGDPDVGVPVSVNMSSVVLVPSTATVSYQWYRGTTKITGATQQTYTPVAADAGKVLKVVLTVKATGYATQATTLTIEALDVTLAPSAPAPTVAPAVSGDPWVGRKLTVSSGTWSPKPTKITYQWYRESTPIAKATAASYTLVPADEGAGVWVRVTAFNGTLSTVHDSATSFVETHRLENVTPPTLPVTAQVGTKLTLNPGTWDLAPTGYKLQWYVNDQALVAATTTSYVPKVGDLGEEIRVEVIALRTGYMPSDTVATASVTVVAGPAMKATKASSLTVAKKSVTKVKLGQTVVASAATWPANPSSVHTQWQYSVDGGISWGDIGGATSGTWVVEGFVAGDQLRYVTTAVRTGYQTSTSVSPVLTIIP